MIQYDKKEINVKIGAFDLKLETFKDLDQTIDDLCASLPQDSKIDPLSEDLCPYFGVVWPSAIALSKELLRLEKVLQDKTLLELGCGLAIPSFVASTLKAKVLATDFHQDVEPFLKANQKLNQISFNYQKLNWNQDDLGQKFDFVIGSDILYESRHPQAVAKALIKFVKPQGEIILADPGRSYLQQFVTSMNQLGFKEELFPVPVEQDEIFVLKFKQ